MHIRSVLQQLVTPRVRLAAHVAPESGTSVDNQVPSQLVLGRKALLAEGALERACSGVDEPVALESVAVDEDFVANITPERPLPSAGTLAKSRTLGVDSRGCGTLAVARAFGRVRVTAAYSLIRISLRNAVKGLAGVRSPRR